MASNSSTNKRRRTTADVLHISDLPIGFIADVSAYLSKPSRAILAVAFSAPSSSWKINEVMHRLSPISKAIVSASQWDTLDFQDINKELANKLTDNDISAVLKSINARDVLKRLKLCGCTNITGIGLHPLRGSVVLEQLDISFARKHETQYIDPEPKISHELVMPILQSIISDEGCSLKHILFPMKWRNGYTNDGLLESLIQFEQEYNTLLANRQLKCAKCNAEMGNMFFGERYSMLQNNVCYDCLRPFCDDCANGNGAASGTLNFCAGCDKDYCVDCMSRAECVVLYCREKKCVVVVRRRVNGDVNNAMKLNVRVVCTLVMFVRRLVVMIVYHIMAVKIVCTATRNTVRIVTMVKNMMLQRVKNAGWTFAPVADWAT